MGSYPKIGFGFGAGLLLFLCFFFFFSGVSGVSSGGSIEYYLEPKLITGGGPFFPPSVQTLTDSHMVVKSDVSVFVTASAMNVGMILFSSIGSSPLVRETPASSLSAMFALH